jgi:hypothetical protein
MPAKRKSEFNPEIRDVETLTYFLYQSVAGILDATVVTTNTKYAEEGVKPPFMELTNDIKELLRETARSLAEGAIRDWMLQLQQSMENEVSTGLEFVPNGPYDPDDIFDRVMATRTERHTKYNGGDTGKRRRDLARFGRSALAVVEAYQDAGVDAPGTLGNAILVALKNLRTMFCTGDPDSYDDGINYFAMGAECAHYELGDQNDGRENL